MLKPNSKYSIHLELAKEEEALEIAELVNLAFRGISKDGKKSSDNVGWTHEGHLVSGPRIELHDIIDRIKNQYTEKNIAILVYRNHENDEIIAAVNLERQNKPDQDLIFMGMVTIHPRYQGTGLGTDLLEKSQEWAIKNWESKRIKISVLRQRSELFQWYLKRGFIDTSIDCEFPPGAGTPGQSLNLGVLIKSLEN